MAMVTNCYMFSFLKGLKRATATHKVSKTVSVDATQRHVGREKYTEQKGWPWPKHHHTDSWASYQERQSALLFWFSRTRGWQRRGRKSLCSRPCSVNFQSWARGNCLRDQTGSNPCLFHPPLTLPSPLLTEGRPGNDSHSTSHRKSWPRLLEDSRKTITPWDVSDLLFVS